MSSQGHVCRQGFVRGQQKFLHRGMVIGLKDHHPLTSRNLKRFILKTSMGKSVMGMVQHAHRPYVKKFMSAK
jgi:hypothetical protein